MSRPFLEVFPGLSLTGEETRAASLLVVDKVTIPRGSDSVRIDVVSGEFIAPRLFRRLERRMAGAFGSYELQIRIYEHFHLQEDADRIVDLCWEDLKEELTEKHPMFGKILDEAKREPLKDGKLSITIADNVFTRAYGEELLKTLEEIFTDRLNLPLRVELLYEKRQKKAGRDRHPEIPFREDILMPDEPWPEMELAMIEPEEEPFAIPEELNVPDPEAPKAPVKEAPKPAPFKRRAASAEGLLYGRDIAGDVIPLKEIIGEMPPTVVRGKLTKLETRETKSGKLMALAEMTDGTDSIGFKLFMDPEKADPVLKELKEGVCVLLKGIPAVDSYSKNNEISFVSVKGLKIIPDFFESRMDNAVEKRVELHCHTKMSDMDGVSEVSDIIKQAYHWGHKAVAITDHGVVQSFPDAYNTWNGLFKAAKDKAKTDGKTPPTKDDFFKLLYGVEAYLVDDTLLPAYGDLYRKLSDSSFVVFDLETTGFSPRQNRIIEIGAVKVEHGKITGRFSEFVNPGVPIPARITELTGIKESMVEGAAPIEEVLPAFLEFAEDCVLVAHNASFDISFIKENCARLNTGYGFTHLDTLQLSRMLFPEQGKHTLDAIAKFLGISLLHHHRAVDDAECTAEIFIKFLNMLEEKGYDSFDKLNEDFSMSPLQISKLHPYHAIILAKNDIGRVNLYRLISESLLNYMDRGKPKLPKSLVMQYREGLILGSACEAGELFRAVLEEKSTEEIERIADFYDYLEIQPTGNNAFMIRSDKEDFARVRTEEDLRTLNQEIVDLGERLHKPVCATCDVHFLNPEDEVYRRILMAGNGFEDAENQPPLYLHTTEEMLKEFAYLGDRKAKEIVITNPAKIADCCEMLSPVRPDKCPPVIEDSDKTLRELCYEKAKRIYGENLPEPVQTRMEKELTSIISNGYSVMYIIAQKLVKKSMDDGYLVGSRGSVGSSLVAFMSGITEVNSLAPHYYCPHCHYSDFDSEEVKAFAGMAGYDMPDKECPVCGTLLKKDGFDIPFETFLGFKGDKEPDIDLNFSSEYQSNAHKYTEVIFGKGQTFRAGTITTLADKTAYGYVKKYFEQKNEPKRDCEINRLTLGCTGVRKSTGQHPGGIVVLPRGENIYSFTPIQHPPKDEGGETITTHFDYHKIEHNLLKLDILGHDDPTMVRRLFDLTGLDPMTIPFDDQKVMSLFNSPEALGITSEDLDGWVTGTLGVPEFGTEFVMQMLVDTKPKYISDLIRIAGLGHGTDVWLGNAQTIIREGQATISECVCCRDDIMIYLINMGMDPALSFKIMEMVRKGKVAQGKCGDWPEWKKQMIEHGVPDWYIGSCEKIQYMFPKAHAAAYVMMAWRIGYYKIYYPQAYYAAYFSIRASAFSYERMCGGRAEAQSIYESLKAMENPSKKELDELKDMRSVLEMYARGIEFAPIDIYKAHSRDFIVLEDGRIMPALTTISNLGEKAADQIMEAAAQGPFLSCEDFKNRSKAGDKTVEQLRELGLLDGLSMTNQISLFDFM